MRREAECVVVGESLVDVIVDPAGRIRRTVGGSPLNVAVGLARLQHSVELLTFSESTVRGAGRGLGGVEE